MTKPKLIPIMDNFTAQDYSVEEFDGYNFEKSEEEFNKIWSDFLPEPVTYEDYFNVDEALLNFENDQKNKAAIAMMNIEGQDPVLSSIPATMSVIGEDQVQFSLMDDIFGGVELPAMTSSPDEVIIEDVMDTHDYCKPVTSTSSLPTPPRSASPILMTRAVALANPLPEPKMSKRQVKPRKHFDESEVDDEDDDSDFEVVVKPKRKAGSKTVKRLTPSGPKKDKSSTTNDPHRKLKLWEIETPFDDPAEEQKRLNAINAKKNRDIKKKQKQSMEKTMTALRQSNEKLQKKYSKSRQRLTAIEAQLQAIVSVIGRDQIDSMLKSSGKDTDLPKFPIEIEYEDGLSSSEDDDESAIEYGSDESE